MLFNRFIQGTLRLQTLSLSIAIWRTAQTQPLTDIFAALMEAKDPETGLKLSHEDLISEAALLIVAGSGTTVTSITATIFYLLHYVDAKKTLETEIRETFDAVEDIRIGPKLASCRFLTCCLDEAMRMSPAVGSILPREILPGGLVVDREWFPPGVDIGVPHYALHHNPDNFTDPFSFKPERWLESGVDGGTGASKPEVALAQSAFAAFGVGRTSCVGKYLAYQEMSLVIARLVWLYDMRLQDGSTAGEGRWGLGQGRQRRNEFQLQDRFVGTHEGPMAEFKLRHLVL